MKEKTINYLPWEVLHKTQRAYEANNFVRFLTSLFGEEKAQELALKYKLGTSRKFRNDGGLAVVFWQIDRAGNIRQAKVAAYRPETGRRVKEKGKSFVAFMGKNILKNQDAHLRQCFFGEHLLTEKPSLPVALVKREKTAAVMAGFLPDAIWLATGGAPWTDRSVYQALEGRRVILYPNLGDFDRWEEKSGVLGSVCDYQVSNLLERKAQGADRWKSFDIADYFIKSRKRTKQPDGFAMENLPTSKTVDHPSLQVTEQEVFEAVLKTNPAVGELARRFGLKVKSVERIKRPNL